MVSTRKSKEVNLIEAIQQYCATKALDREVILDIIKESLVSAYVKKAGLSILENHVKVDFTEDNNVIISIPKKVVSIVSNPSKEISLEEALVIHEQVELDQVIYVNENPMDFSRIISNQAKQLVFQKIKDMEKEILYNEYKKKEGDLTHGYFQRWKKDTMSIDLGKIEGFMPKKEQVQGEKYRQGDRLKAIILKVELKPKETIPVITLSRASADFVRRLFEMEIPEIYDGLVEIVKIARHPSIRTKIVVQGKRSDIDPVGACVGMKGVRIQSIVRELGNERIDIVQYSDDPSQYIFNAISPAKPVEVKVDSIGREALVVVPDESLSLAIGINGSNVKLASQICEFKIDIKTVSQFNEELSSPEARQKLDLLFSPKEEDENTSLSEIPGLSPRLINILVGAGISDVEALIEYSQDDLAKIEGIGLVTASHILKLLSESVEFVEDTK